MKLKARNINKYFYNPDKHKVLNDVSLEVDGSELVSIYGTSGSGKSSLLYILATLDADYSGSLIINDKSVNGMNAREIAAFRNKNIGYVFQFHHLLGEFNTLENVMLPALKLGNKKKPEIKADALKLLSEMGMQSYALRPVNTLSGGQQQRVAIARALINEPSLIIADEPTGNLDQYNSKLIFDLLYKIAKSKSTSIILATHNSYIQKKSDRSFEMIDGMLRL